jgi:hypothetical protein
MLELLGATWELRWVDFTGERGQESGSGIQGDEMASDEKPTTEERLAIIEALLRDLVGQKQAKDFYSTAEVAERAGRSEYQVREWCRTGRLEALKRNSGRGRSKEWMISHDELVRYQSHGLREVARSPV